MNKHFNWWKKFLLLPLVLLLVVGCAKKEETVKEYQYKREDDLNTTILTFRAQGDKIVWQSSKSKSKYASINVENADGARAIFGGAMKTFQDVVGVEAWIEYYDDYFEQEISVDYTKVNLESLKSLPAFNVQASDPEKISLKDTTNYLKEQGYIEVK